MSRPAGLKGLWHLALNVADPARSRAFYESMFGMQVVWQPDGDNVYLSSGRDNLALHRIPAADLPKNGNRARQSLDHLGFVVDSMDAVDRVFARAEHLGVPIVKPPKQHRDGSYSFYVADPDENIVQVLYEPTIGGTEC